MFKMLLFVTLVSLAFYSFVRIARDTQTQAPAPSLYGSPIIINR